MKIDKTLISKLERLARLDLSKEEKDQIEGDLNNILKMVEKMDELDTSKVEPLVYISEEVNVFRPDEIKNQLNREAALSVAPKQDGQHFKVPKVIDKK